MFETLEKQDVEDDDSDDDDEEDADEDGILKTFGKISKCLKRPLSDIQVEWTFKNITITSNWTSNNLIVIKIISILYFQMKFITMYSTPKNFQS